MKNETRESILTYYQNTLASLFSPNSKSMPNPEEKKLNEIFESKFYCPQRFAEEIENLVHNSKEMKYVDAIIHFCEENNLDVESVPKLISKPLKEKIKVEAMENNLLKRTSYSKLPL